MRTASFNPFPALVTSEATTIFRAMPTAPVATARRSKAPRGGVWVLCRGLQASLGQSRRSARALAPRCRENGLSSTDERVRGHVTEVTHVDRLFGSRLNPVNGPRVIHMRHVDMYSRDDLNKR